mgnify:CR=1 FL=1
MAAKFEDVKKLTMRSTELLEKAIQRAEQAKTEKDAKYRQYLLREAEALTEQARELTRVAGTLEPS